MRLQLLCFAALVTVVTALFPLLRFLVRVQPESTWRGQGGAAQQQPPVLVLTPLFGAASFLPHYVELLSRVTYPHALISVALLAPRRKDDPATAAAVEAAVRDLRRCYFRRVQLVTKVRKSKLGEDLPCAS